MKVKSFMVLGKKINVTEKEMPLDENYPDAIGLYYLDEAKIVVEKERDQPTLYHELCHSVLARSGLMQVLTPEIQEIVCEVFSHVIDENFIPRKKPKKP